MADNEQSVASEKIDMLTDMVKGLYDRFNMIESRMASIEFRLTSVERSVRNEPLVIGQDTTTESSVSEILDSVRAMSSDDITSFANFADTLFRAK